MPDDKPSGNTRYIIGTWIFTSFVAAVAWYFAEKWLPPMRGEQAESLGALFGGLAFAGLIAAIFLQRQDLKLQTQELAKTNEQLAIQARALEDQAKSLDQQNFETTFFHMLQLHHHIVDGMRRADGNGRERIGRDVFALLYQDLREGVHAAKNFETFKVVANDSIRRNAHALGHYVDNFYCMLAFADKHKPDNSLYIRIIKSQLSSLETIILFYSTFYTTGEHENLAARYRLFDALDAQKHRLFYPDIELQRYRLQCDPA